MIGNSEAMRHPCLEQARKAGNDAIADMLAEAARDRQLQPLRDALAPGGSAAVCKFCVYHY